MTLIDAFILVGGRSSRMGRAKAEIKFQGRTLTGRAADAIRSALPDARITLVAANDNQFDGAAALSEGLPMIFDIYPDRGAPGAVHAALAYTSAEWAFVAACDLAFPSADLIERLSGFISDGIDIVIPQQDGGRLQPLFALYRRDSCLAVLDDWLTNGKPTPALHTIVDVVNARIVAFDEVADISGSERFFTNLNTPDDLRLADNAATPE